MKELNGNILQELLVHPTLYCSQNCLHCFNYNKELPIGRMEKQELSLDILLETIDEMQSLGIPQIRFTGGGEPMEYSQIDEVFEKLSNSDLRLGITTSFTKKKRIPDIESKIYGIATSLWASNPKRYKKMHKNANLNFEEKVSRIEEFCDKDFRLLVQYITMEENKDDVYDFLELMANLDFSPTTVSVKRAVPNNLLKRDSIPMVQEQIARAKMDFSNLKILDKSDRYLEVQKYCISEPRNISLLGADAKVYPCPLLDYTEDYSLGSLKNKSLEEILFGEERLSFLETH